MRYRSAAVALACAASLLTRFGPARALRIRDEAGRPLATIAVPATFTLSFMHSVNLSRVDEEFSVGGGGLTLERVLFDQLSTGMPSGDEDGFCVVDGRFETRPGRRFDEIAVRVSPIPGHELRVDGRVRPLTYWAPTGNMVRFSASRESD
ncbi:MAG TPA: DUF1850 domain-containing protein [Spirochaetales bacterium]|nr:DUF1850 domain-containing protein [Spirochaetales bacterium]HPB65511.1 DUF1850 domain-containing protein [Spirochaetales bacterium]HQO65635.1 DUF1850 domain-containing protein [Spirochaetales bacterium]